MNALEPETGFEPEARNYRTVTFQYITTGRSDTELYRHIREAVGNQTL